MSFKDTFKGLIVESLNEISMDKKRDYFEKSKQAKRAAGFGWEPDENTMDRAWKRMKPMMKVQDEIKDADNPVTSPKVHDKSREDDGDVYDWTQTSDKINDGDVIKLSGGRTAILVKAWPTMAVGESKTLHTLDKKFKFETYSKGRYKKSFELAKKNSSV